MSYNINRSLIVPDTQYCKLRLQHIENILGLTLDGFVLNANSCFDPLASVGAGQPEGFDAWAVLYDHYEVTGCAVKLSFINHSAAHVNLYLQPTLDSVNLGNAAIVGNPYGKTKILSPLTAGGVSYIGFCKS